MFNQSKSKDIVIGCILAFICSQNVSAVDQFDASFYNGMKFYYGDNHAHTGFSGDNSKLESGVRLAYWHLLFQYPNT